MPVISFCLASISFQLKKPQRSRSWRPKRHAATQQQQQFCSAALHAFVFFYFSNFALRWQENESKAKKEERQRDSEKAMGKDKHKAGLKNTNAHEKLMRTLRLYREGHKVKCISNSIGGTHLLLPSTAFYEPLCCCRLRLISAASARLAVNAFGFSVSACLSHCLSVCSFVCLCWVRQTSIN